MEKVNFILTDKEKFIELDEDKELEIIGGNNSPITQILDKIYIFYKGLFND